MSDPFLKDFDILSPPKRFAVIGGEKIDVTIIPARAAFKFIDFSRKYSIETLESIDTDSFDPGMIESMLEIVELVCKRSSSVITKEWLLDNVPIKILMEFIQYVFEGMKSTDSEKPSGDEKNSMSGT